MGLTKRILKFAAPVPDIEKMERFLFIGPHPDDIEVGAGATAAKLASTGKDVRFFICTDGRFGFDNAPSGLSPEKLAEIRREEALQSAAKLGVSDVQFGELSDGALYHAEELFDGILSAISSFRPDMVFCPDPDVSSECHSDHLNVGQAVKRAVCFAPNEEIMKQHGLQPAPVKALGMYMTAKPNRYVGTTGFLEKQLAALFQCHRSQFPEGSAAAKSISLYLRIRAFDFGLRSLHRTAEGFRVLGQIHMHCFPEAGD